MWIEVSDGSKIRWVLDEYCLNEHGVACSSVLPREGGSASAPDWLKSPEQSVLREETQLEGTLELRSKRSTIPAILEFYRTCVENGGLKLTATPRMKPPGGMMLPRRGPGFQAESDAYRFRIDAFEHVGIVFWTIQYGAKASPATRRPRRPSQLRVLGTENDRANLLDENSGERYSAPLSALVDSLPGSENISFVPQPIRWNSLPEWLHFRATQESTGELRGYMNSRIEEMWWASGDWNLTGDPEAMFTSALRWLDDRGFDRTGEQTPARSYFVSILQDGASLNLKAKSEMGDWATFTVLDTLGHLSLHINYHPSSGTPPPPTIQIRK